MKTLLAVERDPPTDMAAADLVTQVAALFAACPNLCGFVVEDLSGLHGDANPHDGKNSFVITQVSFGASFSREEYHQVCSLIVGVIANLIEEQAEAYELLRGRTFARTLN